MSKAAPIFKTIYAPVTAQEKADMPFINERLMALVDVWEKTPEQLRSRVIMSFLLTAIMDTEDPITHWVFLRDRVDRHLLNAVAKEREP